MSLKILGSIAALTLIVGASLFLISPRQTANRIVPARVSMNPTSQAGTSDKPLFTAFPDDLSPKHDQTPGVDALPFTYTPKDRSSAQWPEGTSRLLFPRRLLGSTNARVHVYIYLPTDNPTDTTPEQSYLPTLSTALEQVASRSDVVIMTPHHSHEGDDYTGFDLAAFYEAGLTALRSALPGATVIDTVVSGHGSSTCKGGPVITQALNDSLTNVRGLVVYDGCLAGPHVESDQSLTPKNFSPSSGVAVYLGVNTAGMGSDLVKTPSGGELLRPAAVQTLWRVTPQDCTLCAQKAGIEACYGPNARFERSKGSSLMSVTLKASHTAAIRTMTEFALCEFYGS